MEIRQLNKKENHPMNLLLLDIEKGRIKEPFKDSDNDYRLKVYPALLS
ncbi:hypothetical protein SAAL107622_06075 [Lacicoccus alkaliphilus]|uniref:Uncharacterized protein n=1 Tax=Lacicoccus alkaliphilus DSM 16010 TaxID=1123231 RepID=A0A1M7BV04_9BACL|nr:hypothetical protein SAMN02745189_00599 [Salinicoccus alkaliphilus DSM 16010]